MLPGSRLGKSLALPGCANCDSSIRKIHTPPASLVISQAILADMIQPITEQTMDSAQEQETSTPDPIRHITIQLAPSDETNTHPAIQLKSGMEGTGSDSRRSIDK